MQPCKQKWERREARALCDSLNPLGQISSFLQGRPVSYFSTWTRPVWVSGTVNRGLEHLHSVFPVLLATVLALLSPQHLPQCVPGDWNFSPLSKVLESPLPPGFRFTRNSQPIKMPTKNRTLFSPHRILPLDSWEGSCFWFALQACSGLSRAQIWSCDFLLEKPRELSVTPRKILFVTPHSSYKLTWFFFISLSAPGPQVSRPPAGVPSTCSAFL